MALRKNCSASASVSLRALRHALLAELVGLPGLADSASVPRRTRACSAGVSAALSAPAMAAATSLWIAKMLAAVSSRS